MLTGLIIGLFAGVLFGMFIMCLLVAARDADRRQDGIHLETMGSFETNPFQKKEVDDEDELGRIIDNLNKKYGSPAGLKRAIEQEFVASGADDDLGS